MYTPAEARHAFAVDPVGPVPYSSFQVFGLFIVTFGNVPAIVACVLRWYVRRLSSGLGLDDWLIFLATALEVPQTVFAVFYIRTGYWGIHDHDIPPHPWNQGLFWSYMNRLFYMPLLVLVKISALLFLLRLGGTKRLVRLSCKALIALLIAQLLAFLPATIFMCQPVEYAWLGVGKGRCFRADFFALSLAVFNVVTDVLTLLIPFLAFVGIKLNKRVRFAILTVFALGGLVTFASALRLYYIIRVWFLRPADRHYSIGYTLNTIEVNLAIITATLPTLWPLGRLWFPRAFETMGLHRPYLHRDIEVGYASHVGPPPPQDGHAENGGTELSKDGASPAAAPTTKLPLKAKILLWLQRPKRPLSVLRPLSVTNAGPNATDRTTAWRRRGHGAFGTPTTSSGRTNLATWGSGKGGKEAESDHDNDDDYYHEAVRRVEMSTTRVSGESLSRGGILVCPENRGEGEEEEEAAGPRR
ncbi:hypothetical protein VTJ49DRAFT_4879 [Mycothermus thermophilus]|uniref:Rhodopsin domain-containing protein n=1 Tax=Humicola insolens TaxID=85995 RepID=A0ABR3V4C3_HUMIN